MDALLSHILRAVRIFDRRNTDKPHLIVVVTLSFYIFSLLLAAAFLSRAFQCSAKKNISGDESFTLEATIRKENFWQVVWRGHPEQYSNVPLDFIFIKVYDDMRDSVQSFGLPKNVYYRLHPILSSVIAGLFAAFLLFHHVRKNVANHLIFLGQACLLWAALGFYYFWYFNFQYSIEMRPYALWNALWFATLALYMYYGRVNGVMVLMFCLLSAASNGSVFQITALFAAVLLVSVLLERESLKSIMPRLAKTAVAPAVIFLFYYLRQAPIGSGDTEQAQQYYREFYQFWFTKEMVPILSILGILLTLPFGPLRPVTTVFVCTMMLYLASPLINHLVISKGSYFSSRHYIYYDLIFPLFLMHGAVALPVYYQQLRKWRRV